MHQPLTLVPTCEPSTRSPTLTKQALSVAQLSRMCWAMVEPVFSTNSPRKSCTNFTSSGSSRLSRATDSWLHLTPKSSHLEQGLVRSVIVNMFLYISDETSVQLEHLKQLEAFQDHRLLAKFDTKNLPPSTEISTIILTLDNCNYVL